MGNTCKKAKTSTIFYAHKLIIQHGAPDLYELIISSEKSSPAPLTGVKPDIFKHMLYYVYGGKIAQGDLKTNAKELISIADKCGVVNLKLEAEAAYATSIALTVDNILDNLLYADSKNCAFLKEVCIDYLVENGKDILGKVSFKNAPGTMMTDLLTAVTRGKGSDGSLDYDTMRVSTLRKKLHEKGLDIDGSRETMISLLKSPLPEDTSGDNDTVMAIYGQAEGENS